MTIKTLADLQPDSRNANRGTQRGRGLVETSLQKYGAGRSVLVDRNGVLIAGNKTTEAAAAIGLDEVVVVQTDGRQLVVVQRTDLDLNEDTAARELAIADNRAGELGLEWDSAVLAELGSEIDLSTFWTKDEIAALLQETRETGGGDLVPDVDEGPTRCQPGDLWRLGEHRLLCGDSTKVDDVARLMGGERATAVITDSPYGIERESVANDDEVGLRSLFDGVLAVLPCDDAVVVNFQSPRLFPVWLDAVRAAGHQFERALWSYKPNGIRFPWRGWILKSDIVLVSTIGSPQWPDSPPNCHDTYTYTHEFEIEHIGAWHGSVKPLEIVQNLVGHTVGLVYEPFAGSGTTIIACERLGRACRAVEITPAHCDVILKRWEAESGQPAERVE